MRIWSPASREFIPLVLIGAMAAVSGPAASTQGPKDNKPSIAVRATPAMGFAPFRAVLTVDVKGGPDDYEQLYCATAEWEMGDGNRAEQQNDCDPYEAGKSQIKRRYVREQVFDTPGEFQVMFRLKQKNKVIASGQTRVQVRPGIRDGGVDR